MEKRVYRHKIDPMLRSQIARENCSKRKVHKGGRPRKNFLGQTGVKLVYAHIAVARDDYNKLSVLAKEMGLPRSQVFHILVAKASGEEVEDVKV